MSRVALLVCVAVFGTLVQGKQLPSSFKKCPVSKELDDKPNACLASAVGDAIKILSVGGARELGAPALDPLHIDQIHIKQGDSGPISIDLLFEDADLSGMNNMEITEITGKISTPKGFFAKGVAMLKKLEIKSKYKIKGQVLILPIKGSGNSVLSLENIKAGLELTGEPEVKNGKEYLKIKNLKLNIKETSRMRMRLDNLFNGDKALGDNMNLFINKNWQGIYSEMKPAIEKAFAAVYLDYAKKIMENVPFEDIFLVQK